ncbi:adenylate kinase [Leptolyngbya cf. ectocarpi LEGE 11479]|uniref:Adenylate kinase n=1 Tax=Leptolyngbya cf. ectocarpi LEGE 11479 TaxID=1828722 RepID=A0A928WXX9_LEPEC|nr:adenylate kinase [Leptolyngbya ectocarpi]MBE9065377.1 adenylate kinase [Leptolyngbya cf. ectocarpi LEGE 11479]
MSKVLPLFYYAAHDELLRQDNWVIDGFGSLDTVWERLYTADTLVYLDLPVVRHDWWVTKRFLKGATLAGWPDNSPLIKGTLNSCNTVWLCHTKLTPKYREYVEQARGTKRVYHLRSLQEVNHFLRMITSEFKDKQP